MTGGGWSLKNVNVTRTYFLDVPLVDHTGWDVLYGKCSLKTSDKWNADGTPNVALGVFYATLGVVCEVRFMVEILKS